MPVLHAGSFKQVMPVLFLFLNSRERKLNLLNFNYDQYISNIYYIQLSLQIYLLSKVQVF